MTVPSEQYDIKYKGTGVANDTFPIPFSFRHTDALKVETIATDGTATQKTLSTHYTVVQQASSVVAGTSSNIISSNSQRTEFGWIKFIAATTDIIHIYREETFVQDYDYTDTVAVPAEQFEKSCDRLVDGMTTQLSRSSIDPSKYGAMDRKISSLDDPVRNDDLLTKGILDDMGTTASLTVTNPPSGSAHAGKLLTPSGLAPSTPTTAWASRLGLPSTSGTTPLYVLSPVDDYANAPFIEWTIPRWIIDPEANGLRYVFSYGTDAAVEGEGTDKTARWREFREMLDTPSVLATDANKVIRLKSTTWSPPDQPTVQTPSGSYEYELPNEPSEGTEASRDLRMVAGDDGNFTYSPRMKIIIHTFTVQYDSGLYQWRDGDGTYTQDWGGASSLVKHAITPWVLSNSLYNDSGVRVMPQMVFMQAHTAAVTTSYGGLVIPYTAYPVFHPFIDAIDNTAVDTNDEFILDSTSSLSPPDDGVSNSTIEGWVNMMNCNAYPQPPNDKYDNVVPAYLHWSGTISIKIRFLLVFGSEGGGIK